MSENNYGSGLDEQLRREEDERLRQQMEQERIERERIEAEARAAEEAASAAREAESAAETAQTEAASAVQDVSSEVSDPVFAGVRSRGAGAVDRQRLAYTHETRKAISDTGFTIGKYDTEEGYTPEEGREMLEKLLLAHALDNPTKEETQNDAYINYNTIRNKEQAFAFMPVYSDDSAKVAGAKRMAKKLGMDLETFLSEAENYQFDKFGRNLFSSPYSDAAKNRAYIAGVQSIGLTGVDGQALDPYKMTTADMLLACRMDPSGATADAMYELAKAGSQIPGNPWYGQTVEKDMFKFVDSADLTMESYKEEVAAINESFTYSNERGVKNPNVATLAELYGEIKAGYADNPRVMGYYLRDLKKSFTDHTGLEAPPDALLDKILAETADARDAAKNATDDPEEGKKGAIAAIKEFLFGAPEAAGDLNEAKPEEKKPETKTVEQIISEIEAEDAKKAAPGGSSVITSGGTATVNGQNVQISPPIASTGMPPMQDLFGENEQESAVTDGFDNPMGMSEEWLNKAKGKAEAEAYGPTDRLEYLPYDSEMTDAQAWMYQQAGYVLAPENQKQISRYANNEFAGLMTGELAVESGDPHVFRKHGSILGETAQAIATSGLRGEARADAELALLSLAADIYDMYTDVQNPIVRPSGANMYDYAFSLDSALVDRNAAIMDSLKTAKGAYSENVVQAAEERQARMDGYAQTVMAGNGDEHAANELAQYYAGDMVDIYSDDTYNEMIDTMSPWGDYFGEDGTFWQGDSMAAQEARNIMIAGGKQGFYNFQNDLYMRVEDLLGGYTTAAHNMGMTLGDFLKGSNIGGLDQVVRIAYNSIQAEGNAIANDKEFQAMANTAAQNPQGTADIVFGGENRLTTGDAIGHGVNTAWTDYKESFAHASYTMMDLAMCDATTQETHREYRAKYGEDAEAMRRRDLNAVIASGELSEDMANELRRDMARAYNIFDVCYDIDATGLKGYARQSASELGKKLDMLRRVTATLEPEQQQLVNMVSGISGNLIGGAVQIGTTGIGMAIGLPASVAGFIGSVAGFGMGTFDDAYRANESQVGMSRATAAKAAALETVGMTAIESLNMDSLSGLFFGGATMNGVNKAMRNGGLKNIARALAVQGLTGMGGEAFEEGAQTGVAPLFDALDQEFLAYDRGEGFNILRSFGHIERELKATDYAELGKEVISSMGAGAAYGGVYALIGLPFSGRAALKDAHAYNQYESVQLATQIAEGDLEANNENLGKVYAALKEDLQDANFRRYLDKGSKQANQNRNIMTAMLEGTMLDTLDAATDHALKANEYDKKADAAGKAVENSKGDYLSLRELVANGDLDKKAALESAQNRWAKAVTTYNEAKNAAEKERNTAARSVNAWLDGCKERGKVLTAEGMQTRMEQIANVRMGIAKRLDTLYSAMDNAKMERDRLAADVERSDALAQKEVDYAEGAVFGEEAEIDEELSLMDDVELDEDIEGLSAQIAEAEARVSDVSSRQEELGIGSDTVQALTEQELAPLTKRKERIIAREKGRFNDAFDRMQQALEMDNDDSADQIQTEYDGIAARLQTLGEDVEALMMEQYGINPKEANAAYEAAQEKETQRAEDEKLGKLTDDLSRRMETTNASLEAVNPARWYFAKNPIYVNESQAADILSAEGLKSISQFNRRYGTKLTTKEADGAMPLDGHVLSDISAEAAGSVNADGDPVAEMLTVLQRGKELTATQRAEKAEARELRETKKAADKQRRNKVDALVKPIQTEADAAAANSAANSAIEVTPSHTAKQQRDILAFQKAVDNEVLKAAQAFRQDPNSGNVRVPISKVGDREANAIKNLTGINTDGYTHTADRNFFKHVERRHGVNGEADKSMSLLQDVARVGWVIENYDSIELSKDSQGNVRTSTGYIDKNGNPEPMIVYTKKLDGSVYVVEAVGESKWKKLWLVSAYIQKNGPANQSQNQAVTQTPHAVTGLEPDVRNANASPANNSLAQGNGTVNNNPNISAMAAGGTAQTPAQKQAQRSKKLEGSALKAVQNLAKDMKVGLRVKSGQRFQSADARMGKGVLGYYKNGQRNAIVRSADAGRVSVTGHEIGHALQEQLGITSNSQMINSWQATFGNTGAYTPQQYDHEAFAEFFWRYLTGRDAAVAYAGDSYVDAFEQALRQKKLNKQVAKAQTQVSAYWNSEAEAKIRARIVNAYDAKTPEDTAFARRVEIRLADDTAAAEDFQDVIRKRTGKKHLSLEDNLRDTIRFNRRASARANECLTKALVDQNGDVVGESLKDALSDIKGKDFDLFWEYELAKHSLDRDAAKGSVNQVFDEDTLSTADRKALVAKLEQEHPEFKKANERFQQWRRLFMDTYLVNNGFLGDPAQASLMMDALDAAYPNYVPTYRPKSKADKRATVGGKTYQMRTATGSTEDVINPFDSFVSMVNSIVQMTADNDSRKKFAALYDRYAAPLPGETGPGVGLFANEITQDMQRVSVSTEGMRNRITKMLDAIGTDPDVITQIGDIIGDEKVEYHGTGRVNMNNVITVRMDDGSKRYFEVYNPELYTLLSNTNTANRAGLLDGLAKATRMMSMLTTGSNPVFGLTNAMRDFQNSVNYGSWAASYTDGAVKWLGALWDVVTNGEASKEYDSLGGGGWTAFDTSTKKGSEQIRGEVVKGYNRSNVGRFGKMVGRKIWSAATMSKLNEAIEKTSRLAEYKYGKHDLTTTEGRIEAFLAAQDVTTDFSRRGNGQIARDLKNLVPFFNASTQGIYRNTRQFSAQESDRAGIRFAKNVVNSALASAIANGLLLSYLDDDEKEEFFYLSNDLKAKHMFLPNFAPDIFGDAALIRIPLDQNPVSYAVNAAVANFFWEGESDNEFVVEMSAVANAIKDNLNPVGSTILDPAISVLSNKNWYGSDIVPSYLESYDETNQYTEETPTPFVEASKRLSDVGIKVSPMMLQYMAEQYTGYIGQTLIPALPSEKNQNGIVAGVLNALVATARKRVTSDPLKSNDVVSTVYDSFDEMTEVYKAGNSKRNLEIDYFRPNLTERERRRGIREADDLIHSGGDIYEAKKDISAGYDRIDQINDRDDLTDEEKHVLIQKVRRDMVETALDIQEVMNDYNTRYKDDGIVKQFITWLFNREG